MAKNPIFPLYYNDIDRSTRDWTDEEFGAYMRLLMEQWDKGFLPNDYQRLTRIATSLSTTWPTIKSKFAETPAGLQNLRLEEIREERLSFIKKQSENVRKRYQTSTKPPTKNLPSIEDEDEIENANCIKNSGKKESFLKDQKWKEEFCMAKNLQMPALEKFQAEFISDTDLKGEYVDSYKRYFTNWFNKNKNGTHQQNNAKPAGKLGTSDARIDALKKW